jgi:hypothetical protein
LVGKPEGRIPLGNLRVKGRIILKWIFKKWDGGTVWVDLDQDRDKLLAVVNAVINLLLPSNSGNFLSN